MRLDWILRLYDVGIHWNDWILNQYQCEGDHVQTHTFFLDDGPGRTYIIVRKGYRARLEFAHKQFLNNQEKRKLVITMARNVNVSVPSVSQLLAFTASLPNETRAQLPTEDSTEWYPHALEMFNLAQADDSAPVNPNAKPRPPAEAKHYTVLVLRADGRFDVIGGALGQRGATAKDPSKLSELSKIERAAEVRVAKYAQNGIKASMIRVPTDSLGDFIHA